MKTQSIYLIIIIFLSAFFVSCEDFLTQDNPNSVVTDDEWWETEANATGALGSVYSGVPRGTSGRNIMLVSSLSDETIGRQSSFGDYEQYTKSLQTADWSVALHIWRDDYLDIRRANRFLANINRVYMREDLKQRYIYEARALRAYYHMELFLFFGPIPISDHPLNQSENYLPRNTEEECYDFIFTELRDAAEGLPERYTPADRWRISKPACWALITRLALFYHKYDVAAEYAKKIIDTNKFELFPDYSKLFTYDGEGDANNERIMIKNSGCDTAWDRFAPKSVGGRTATSPTDVVVNNFETKQGKTIWELGEDSVAIYKRFPNYRSNRDPRLSVSVLLPNDVFDGQRLQPFEQASTNPDRIGVQQSTASGYWVKKYLDTKDRYGTRKLYFMIIRYAEVLLNYTEALIESDDWENPDVVKYLNMVRNRAGMPDVDTSVYNTKEKLRELVRRERQAELSFEGQRFFDIRRWDIATDVMNGDVYGATNPDTGETYRVETRTYRPNRDVRYPIPRGEIIANPNIKQNSGY